MEVLIHALTCKPGLVVYIIFMHGMIPASFPGIHCLVVDQ